jgi:mannose-1-phosphate guanylyltransferase
MTGYFYKNLYSSPAFEKPILIPAILSSGAASRLLPVSREDHPKPCMKMADGQSLLGKTYRRAANLPEIYKEDSKAMLTTVTNPAHAQEVKTVVNLLKQKKS